MYLCDSIPVPLFQSEVIARKHLHACSWDECLLEYLAKLPDSRMRGLPCVLAIYGILFEEQVDLVIFWVVTLRDQMDGHKPGVCDTRSDCLRPK